MKTSVGMQSIRSSESKRLSRMRSLFKRVALFVDGLIVRYYYKGERLRPEVRKRIEQGMKDAEREKNLSPAFTDVDAAFKWLDSQ